MRSLGWDQPQGLLAGVVGKGHFLQLNAITQAEADQDTPFFKLLEVTCSISQHTVGEF